MLGIENDRLVVLTHLGVGIGNLAVSSVCNGMDNDHQVIFNTYKIRTSLIIRNTLSLNFSLRGFLIKHKRHGVLTSLRIIIKSLQSRANCTTFKQFKFTFLVDF